MHTTNGTHQAIIKHRLVSEDSLIHGYKITRITADTVYLQVGNELKSLHIGDSIEIEPATNKNLVLEDLFTKDGQRFAQINGKIYKAGTNNASSFILNTPSPTNKPSANNPENKISPSSSAK